jgi:Peptidase inhibitor I78 family
MPFPFSTDVFPPSARNFPVLVRELVGRPCRVVTPMTVITVDFNQERVNFVVDEHGIVIDIRFG